MACIGGLAWVFLMPRLDGSANAAKRVERISTRSAAAVAGGRERDGVKRKRQVEETIKDIEQRSRKKKKRDLKMVIRGAGLSWSVKKFWVISVIIGVVATAGSYIAGAPFAVTVACLFIFTLGFPRWLLKFLTARRERAFLNEFANSVDVIVRGVKAGLPLGDCLRMVAQESVDPVRSEFRHIIETQALGVPLGDAVARMYDRMPLAEVSFFVIVITIQQKTGGNLSDTLSNLSKVLRDRKKMKGKIVAMSQEAKSSAAIIGSLPLIVMGLISLTTPSYISLLWTEQLGQLMLMGCAFWMFCGVMIMRKMINFDF
ncbi:MAG: type II secretion system F family protein [Rhodobiaceae bacterium]|nr:type II secretion system F family protein [Rhodobiaceae bacterium]MCC0049943.1 type II secretion system F family protein [Rhodobiaceae bacterium]